MTLLSPWLKSFNVWAVVILIGLGGVIVTGIFRAGANYNEGKHVQATAETNKVIVEARGKDEAEIAANDKAGKDVDETVKANLKQTLILDKDTALWLGLVK